MGGLLVTAEIALISIVIGTALGIIIGLSRTPKSNVILFINRVYLELFRIILILVPQAIRRMLPGNINLAARMVKTTSLVVLIGVIDVVKVGQQIIETSRSQLPTASFWVYGLVFILYFVICYPLSKLSKRLETKLNGYG